jgi:hypothetical protein
MSVLRRSALLGTLASLVHLASLPGTSPVEAAIVVGVGAAAPVWVYYPPPPPYVVYPPYLYPGGVFIGATFGPYIHRHWHHWR